MVCILLNIDSIFDLSWQCTCIKTGLKYTYVIQVQCQNYKYWTCLEAYCFTKQSVHVEKHYSNKLPCTSEGFVNMLEYTLFTNCIWTDTII